MMTLGIINFNRSASLMDLSPLAQKNEQGSLGEKLVSVKNSSRELKSILDKYGIGLNLDHVAKAQAQESSVILAHRSPEGQINLKTGLYISDPQAGDKYGVFRFHEGPATVKYQVPECTKLNVDEHSLNALRDTYHQISGVTSFLRNVLDLIPGKDLDIFLSRPEYFSYLPPVSSGSNGFLIFPNAPYIDLNALSASPAELKDRRNGICLGAYAIHPNQNLSLIEKMGVATGFAESQVKADHTDNKRRLSDIEAGTDVKYLASILDLGAEDIGMLKALQRHVLSHLAETYDVDANVDKVQLYFHFPPADVTATLHLHARVNVADHPLNQARSFGLSDVIKTLEDGRTMNELVLGRNDGVLYTLVNEADSIRVIPEKSRSENPYTLKLT